MSPNRRSQHVALQQGLDRTPRRPRQPAMADTGADTGADAGADESPTIALLHVAAAEMAGDEESDPTTPTPRLSQRQPQPQLPPYKGKTPRSTQYARSITKHTDFPQSSPSYQAITARGVIIAREGTIKVGRILCERKQYWRLRLRRGGPAQPKNKFHQI